MSVWYVIPSKRPPEQANEVLKLWRERGYGIGIVVDSSEDAAAKNEMADVIISAPDGYRGYARSVNGLIDLLMQDEPRTEWFVTGGDDVEPDPNHSAEEIALECSQYFSDPIHRAHYDAAAATFGVMQPTGDRWGDKDGAYIDRVCGSPWIGREFARRINQGRGPLWPEYYHMGEDEELMHVALKYGVLWQRPDLTHHHRHWGRPRAGERFAPAERMPEFLKRANSGEEWAKYKRLFAERKAAGFPGSEPIA